MKRNDVIGGLIVLTVGLVFLASNLGYLEGQRTSGLPLLLVGSVFLAHNYGVWHLRDSWPMFVIAAGVSILANAWENRCNTQEGDRR